MVNNLSKIELQDLYSPSQAYFSNDRISASRIGAL